MSAISTEQVGQIDIPRTAIVQLASIAISKYEADIPDINEVYGKLPKAMDREGIAFLGANISELVASVVPYSGAEGYGRKSEISAIRRLGNAASAHGDEVTYESARQHLKTRGARGKAAATLLWWGNKLGLAQ